MLVYHIMYSIDIILHPARITVVVTNDHLGDPCLIQLIHGWCPPRRKYMMQTVKTLPDERDMRTEDKDIASNYDSILLLCCSSSSVLKSTANTNAIFQYSTDTTVCALPNADYIASGIYQATPLFVVFRFLPIGWIDLLYFEDYRAGRKVRHE